jgi:hypothetical protein
MALLRDHERPELAAHGTPESVEHETLELAAHGTPAMAHETPAWVRVMAPGPGPASGTPELAHAWVG